MVRDEFDDAFERMRDQSNRLADTERTADNFDEIVEERVELDRLRDEVTAARKNIVSRFEPPATDVVESPRGYTNTKLWGKVVAAGSVALLVAGGFFIYQIIDKETAQLPLEFTRMVESIDTSEGCTWRIDATLYNGSDESVQLERVDAILNRANQRARADRLPSILPGESAPLSLQWPQLEDGGRCATTPDDVSHGNIILRLDDGTSVSLPVRTE